jgi:hypothetical protein
MAFTVQDFDDLIRLLDEKPEWREAMRRRVLTDELLDMPRVLRELADAQLETRKDLTTLTQRLDTLVERVDALVEAQLRSEQRLIRVEGDTGRLKGMVLELRYAERPFVYFKDLIRRARTLTSDELYDVLESIELTKDEVREVIESDVVAIGRSQRDSATTYLVAEVSWGIGPDDVERAARRAALLARSGQPVIPVVAGDWITPQALEKVSEERVWYVLGGRAIEPD